MELYGGSFNKLMHVLAVGSRSTAEGSSIPPDIWMHRCGRRYLQQGAGGGDIEVGARRVYMGGTTVTRRGLRHPAEQGKPVARHDGHSSSLQVRGWAAGIPTVHQTTRRMVPQFVCMPRPLLT